MATTQRIRIGIVGVGWGALVYGPAFRAVPEFVDAGRLIAGVSR